MATIYSKGAIIFKALLMDNIEMFIVDKLLKFLNLISFFYFILLLLLSL